MIFIKTSVILLLLFFFSACSDPGIPVSNHKEVTYANIGAPAFQEILDSAGVTGAILILDDIEKKYYSNDFLWCKKGQLPASTFKIPNSMIALETEVVADDQTLFKWDGQPRSLKIWEQDLVFSDAFKYSCVPCYQKIARDIGVDRMREFLSKLDYGKMLVDSSNLDLFWLTGNSTISPFQEIDFLKRFYQSKLPISKKTENTVKNMLLLVDEKDYDLFGKTGWSVDGDKNNGWFVGYLNAHKGIFYFATNIEPKPDFDMTRFSQVRKEVTYQALRTLDLIK